MSDQSLHSLLEAFGKTRLGHPDDPDDLIDMSEESVDAENIAPNHELRQPAVSKSPANHQKTCGQANSSSEPQSEPENTAHSSNASNEHNRHVAEALMASAREDPWSLESFLKSERERKRLEDEEANDLASYEVIDANEKVDHVEPDAEEFEVIGAEIAPNQRALEEPGVAKEEDPDDGVLIDEREVPDPTEQPLTLEEEFRASYPGLHALDETGILNDVRAQITFDGPMGTINGFRLGRLDGYPRNEEFNSAWGEALLLLNFLAGHLGCRFTRYALWPRGNRSCIQDRRNGCSTLPLYLIDQANLEAELAFDKAQRAFLSCMKRVEKHLKRRYANFRLAFRITKNRLLHDSLNREVYLITKRGNLEKSWTKALKYTLVDLKQFLGVFMKEHRDRLRKLPS